MSRLRALSLIAALLGAGYTQAQAPAPQGQSTPRAPGVTRAVEHPDPTVDQAQPDAMQPETAKDDEKLKPETATDAAAKSSSTRKALEIARQGVRSNTAPPPKPQG
jgi:hypothetical protein